MFSGARHLPGQRIGYLRVSSVDQIAERQLDCLELDLPPTIGDRLTLTLRQGCKMELWQSTHSNARPVRGTPHSN